MEPTRDVIISQLHALSIGKKPTLADVFKAFHLFITTHNQVIASDAEAIVRDFLPTNDLGKLFRHKLVKRYQLHSEVIKLIQSGDTFNITQVMKCDWFFTDVADPLGFVQETVPTLSLSTRMKMINKYATHLQNPLTAQEVYTNMRSIYGIRSAILLLPACSEDFIKLELSNIKIKLPPILLSDLYKKYPHLTLEYLKLILKKSDSQRYSRLDEYKSVFIKLSITDLNQFIELYQKHNSFPHMQLGRRTTKRLIKTHVDAMVSDYSKFNGIIQDRIFLTRIPFDKIKKVYSSHFFPEKLGDFMQLSYWNSAVSSLSYLKRSAQPQIVTSGFSMKYNKEITSDDVLFLLEPFWLEYLPVDARVKWVEKKTPDIESPSLLAKYLANLPVDLSMPQLKKLIESQTDPNARIAIAKSMVETLKANQCSRGISDLFAYFVKRFRNETSRFREAIVNETYHLDKLYLKLEVEEWSPILDFFYIIKLNNETSHFSGYRLRSMFSHLLYTCFTKNVNVEPYIRKYLELEQGESGGFSSEVFQLCEGTPYHKDCIEWSLKELPNVKWSKDSPKSSVLVSLFSTICEYNSKNKGKVIEIPDWLISFIDEVLNDSDQCHQADTIQNNLKINQNIELHDRLLRKAFPNVLSSDLVCYFLRKDPEFILTNIRSIMEKAFAGSNSYDDYSWFYRLCRLYKSFGIPREVVKICRVALKLDDPEYDLDDDSSLMLTTSQPHAIRALAMFLEPSEYLELISHYAPTQKKIEGYSDEIQATYDIQKAVCSSFNDISTPTATLPLLRRFAVGDYLKYVCSSLLGVCTKVPQKEILKLIEEWINCPVSLRKHFFRLVFMVAPTEYSVNMFTNIFKTEKNISLRLLLFRQLQKTFFHEPADESFQTYVSIINQLTEKDEEALKALFDLESMDQDYISQYIELLWELTDSDWGAIVKNGKSKIVDVMNKDVIKVLKEEFCDVLLQYEMTSKLPSKPPSEFLRWYLLFCNLHQVQLARLAKTMTVLKPYIESHWDTYEFTRGPVFPIRQTTRNLVKSLCRSVHEHKELPIDPTRLLTDFKRNLSSVIKPEHFALESLWLDSVTLYCKHNREEESASYVSAMANLLNTYIQNHPTVSEFVTITNCQLEAIGVLPNTHKLAVELITKFSDPHCHILGLSLLDSGISEEEHIPTYRTVIEALGTSEHPGVQMALDNFFKALECSEQLVQTSTE